MKINSSAFLVLLFGLFLTIARCKKADFGNPVIIVTGTEENPIVKFSVASTPATYTLTATSSVPVEESTTVTFALDTAAVTLYNKQHGTTYYAIPDAVVELSSTNAVINAGSSTSSAITATVVNTEPLVDGRSYLIPITIKNVTGKIGVLNSSKTIFLRIARVYNFSAIAMNNSTGSTATSNGYFNAAALFNTTVNLSNFTLEMKCLIYGFRLTGTATSKPEPIQTLGAWENADESQSIGLRFGEVGSPGNALQLIGTLGSAFIDNFNTNQWYTLSITYDGNNCTVYVDGVAEASVSGSMVLPFSRLNIGQSWDGYNVVQFVNGRVGEIRVWNRALTPGEISLNLCGADTTSTGLIAYWKMNEGSGYIFHNSASTGSQYDMDWSKVYWDINGSGNMILVDKSKYVTWTNDALNTCSQ